MKIQINAKLVSLVTYEKKDDKKVPTGEKGYIISLAIDYSPNNELKNKIISPLCSKEFEIAGDAEYYTFGADVLVDIDIPLVDVGDMAKMPPVLYSMVRV